MFLDGCLDEFSIKISGLWGKQIALLMWVGLDQSIEGSTRKDWVPLSKKKFCWQTTFRLELQSWVFPRSPASWPTLQIWDWSASIIGKTKSLKWIYLDWSIMNLWIIEFMTHIMNQLYRERERARKRQTEKDRDRD